jgi:hypothetical protein
VPWGGLRSGWVNRRVVQALTLSGGGAAGPLTAAAAAPLNAPRPRWDSATQLEIRVPRNWIEDSGPATRSDP